MIGDVLMPAGCVLTPAITNGYVLLFIMVNGDHFGLVAALGTKSSHVNGSGWCESLESITRSTMVRENWSCASALTIERRDTSIAAQEKQLLDAGCDQGDHGA